MTWTVLSDSISLTMVAIIWSRLPKNCGPVNKANKLLRVCFFTAFGLLAANILWGGHLQGTSPGWIAWPLALLCGLLFSLYPQRSCHGSLDCLTGLYTRHEFVENISHKVRREAPFTVIVLSLRGFKAINDKFGQENGNQLLQSICVYLRTITEGSQLYRYSGDEFAVLVPEQNYELAAQIVSKMRDRMNSPWPVGGFDCMVSGAIAVVQYPQSGEDVKGLLSGIEYTVAHAKLDRSKPFHYCTPAMLEGFKRRNQIIDILREMMADERMTLYYQPILSVETGLFAMGESLMRIPDSPIGPISPAEFIPIAEETGLIIDMTYQVLGKVCGFIRRLLEDGVEFESITVNFSAVQFTQKNLAEKVLGILRENGVPPSKIKIEITERILSSNFEEVLSFIETLYQRGMRFGLDDFGTGYSNIATVLSIPIEIVKLDGDLVASAIHNKKSAAMVQYLSQAFRETGMRVLAEGVETTEQSRFVIGCGCDLIQGYLYARPVPEEEALRLMGEPFVEETLPRELPDRKPFSKEMAETA